MSTLVAIVRSWPAWRSETRDVIVRGTDVENFDSVEQCVGRQLCAQRGGEVAVADDVTERGQIVVGAVDHGTAEAAFLRNVDGFDRRRGARWPGIDLFQQLAGAVRQGQGARVALLRLWRSTVQQQRFLAAGGERQMQRHADRAGADDQDVDLLNDGLQSWRITSSISATVFGAVV